jgi:hypothetical protein
MDARQKNVQKAMAQNRRKRAWLAAYKLAKGCVDCGYKAHPAALDFDHVTGDKRFAIGRGVTSNSMEAVMEEIDKCEVVCANCHRVRTETRRKAAA